MGGQNPRFSHFFRCFFDIIFQARFGRRKNRPKMRKKQTFPLFGVGFAVVPRLLGKGKDRGKNTSDRIARTNCSKECRDWPAVIGQSQLEFSLARRWHTFGGRRIEGPRGGTPPATPLREHLAHRSQDMGDPRKHRHSRQTSCGSARSRLFFAYEWPNDVGQVGGKVFATQKALQALLATSKTSKNRAQTLQNRARGLPKSSPEPSKTVFFKNT